MIVFVVVLLLVINQDNDIRSIIKDKKIFEEIKDEKTKDTPELNKLAQKYEDMIGWIEIPGTDFSYPVTQTGVKEHRIKEPEFYLHADVKGEYSYIGTPFLDFRCNPDSDNQIIYGHNIRGGRMFGLLHGYRKTEYYKEHPVIYFTKCGRTREENDIVSVMLADINSFMYTFTDIYTDTIYKENIEKLLAQSIYETEAGKKLKEEIKDADVEELFQKEKFITLSILSSSIHECIIVPDEGFDEKKLQNMVMEVNSTQVGPDERLSDNVYSYDSKEDKLSLATNDKTHEESHEHDLEQNETKKHSSMTH